LAASLLAAASAASADDKKDCGDAYEKTQSMRKAGALQSARQQAVSCSRDVCAEFIRTDCGKWLGEIDQSQPTVVFDVKDGAGATLSAVTVSLDGKPWLTALDGRAKPIDPGAHTLRFEIPGAPPVEQTVQILEGDKNRKLSAALGAPSTAVPAGSVAQPGTPAAEATSRPGPWIVGGIGVAGLIVGAVVGGVVLSKKSIVDANCKPLSNGGYGCSPAGMAATNSGQALGPVSTVGFVVGGVGIAAGALWLGLRKPAPKPAAAVGMGPAITREGAAWQLRGSW
jgi:hypothetical protein